MIIIVFSSIFFLLLYFFSVKKRLLYKTFIDKDFEKPQSFHTEHIPRIGGLFILLTSLFIFFDYTVFTNKNVFIIFIFSFTASIIGLCDDIKINSNPLLRFFLFVLCIISLIFYFDIEISNFDFVILDFLNNFFIFNLLITFFAIFFIINGSNLIDGFNGLLSIHTLIIFCIFLNLYQIDIPLQKYLSHLMFCIFLFLIFNFPKAKIFLGDSGAYFLGSTLALTAIILSNLNTNIPPFLIANIFFYLFFEIFFSVFRKILQRKNPFYPDRSHLHMLLFLYLSKTFKKYANPMTSLIINFIYILSIFPAIIFYDVKYLCELIFIAQVFCYTFGYFILKRNLKN